MKSCLTLNKRHIRPLCSLAIHRGTTENFQTGIKHGLCNTLSNRWTGFENANNMLLPHFCWLTSKLTLTGVLLLVLVCLACYSHHDQAGHKNCCPKWKLHVPWLPLQHGSYQQKSKSSIQKSLFLRYHSLSRECPSLSFFFILRRTKVSNMKNKKHFNASMPLDHYRVCAKLFKWQVTEYLNTPMYFHTILTGYI